MNDITIVGIEYIIIFHAKRGNDVFLCLCEKICLLKEDFFLKKIDLSISHLPEKLFKMNR